MIDRVRLLLAMRQLLVNYPLIYLFEQKNFILQISLRPPHFLKLLVKELILLDEILFEVLQAIASQINILEGGFSISPARLPLGENSKLNLLIDLQ